MKLQETPPIPVIFRINKQGNVTAWFPTLPGTSNPNTCTVYEHIGQHGAGHLTRLSDGTTLATEEEYAPLLRELTEQVRYNLRVVKRVTYAMTQERINALKGVSK